MLRSRILLPRVNFEVQHGSSRDIAFLRCAIAQSLAWASVELGRDQRTVPLRHVLHARALREILTHQPVRVLVRPALPRVVRCRAVEAGIDLRLERGVGVECGAVVDGDRAHGPRPRVDQLRGARVHFGARAPRELANHGEAGLALDAREDARASLTVTEPGVALPVADA